MSIRNGFGILRDVHDPRSGSDPEFPWPSRPFPGQPQPGQPQPGQPLPGQPPFPGRPGPDPAPPARVWIDPHAGWQDRLFERLLEQRIVLASGVLDDAAATRLSAQLLTLDAKAIGYGLIHGRATRRPS